MAQSTTTGSATGPATAPAPAETRPVALWRRAVAEALGTAALVAIVVGSGIMATELSDDTGLRLLENSLATTLGLAVLIAVLGPVSGAHLNPVVSLVDWVTARRAGPQGGGGAADRRSAARARLTTAGVYVPAQVVGGIAGAVLANAMFGLPTTLATHERATAPHLLAEVVATAGLVLVILGLLRSGRETWVPAAVGSYIGAAYWFTSSTSFANPAVTVGRMVSDTFAGIAPGSVLPFIGAQLLGGAVAVGLASVLFPAVREEQARR
ncbi:aquaporin [Myceligenerans indicum]|uniref:Aquaporin family protein n=1 Tax=Myceligenerans indicum TaxID=2593663 RepID=A0ABS1LJ85_9MICO|nr:aquaporin [Myceligenerans indicum]MBL0886089.1 aquaporin family protein [Myceligenerans indicum]